MNKKKAASPNSLVEATNNSGLQLPPNKETRLSKISPVVVKIGGSTLGKHDTTLQDLVDLQQQGVQSVVIHGGGKIISEWMERQGVRPRFVRGLRVTDESSLQIVVAVLTGVVNKSIVASILSMGGRAIGLSGVDGNMLEAKIFDPEIGRVGKVIGVDPSPIETILQAGFIPVIAPVATCPNQPTENSKYMLNVNADTAAGEIAAALKAEHLIVLTDVAGVLDSSRRRIPRLTKLQAEELMHSKVVDGGMIPKLESCLTALQNVKKTHIVDGRRPGVLKEVLAGKPLGTRVG